MFSKLKERLRKIKKKLTVGLVTASLVVCSVVPALASEPETVATVDISGALTSSLNSVISQTLTLMTGILPVALSLFGISFAVKKGMKFFKSTTNAAT